ncbi:hypothetical protein Goshw_028382 [Gossypium schwendimanii]|uniref:SBP-type domain-containing protein n=1 Tax=Gossypium schwendimanii TaxID=34291 RepID=A0A7J9KZM8_GOSSC|nr:hypothetical protein [Gossypium schwendimanii]
MEMAKRASKTTVSWVDDEEKEEEEEQREERMVKIRVVPRERYERMTTFIHYSNSAAISGGGGGCQADECGADLKDAKQYHRRHKVCEPHAKDAFVLVKGIRQRFCQQCSRFHEISKFDGTKRSCRDRLAGHNLRRRKVVQSDQEAENDNSNNKNKASYGKGTDTPMLQQWYREFTH